MSSGSDSWAVKQGWVSITPLGLRSDIIFSQVSHITKASNMSAPDVATIITVYHIVPMLGTRPEAPQHASWSVRVLPAVLQHSFCHMCMSAALAPFITGTGFFYSFYSCTLSCCCFKVESTSLARLLALTGHAMSSDVVTIESNVCCMLCCPAMQ